MHCITHRRHTEMHQMLDLVKSQRKIESRKSPGQTPVADSHKDTIPLSPCTLAGRLCYCFGRDAAALWEG